MASVQHEFDNGIKVDGDSNFTGNVNVQQSMTVVGDLAVSGNLTYSQTSVEDIIPLGNTYALGNTSARWNLFANTGNFSGNVAFGSFVAFTAANTSQPSFRIPAGTGPNTPSNGDVWANSTALVMHTAGANQQLAFITSNISGSAASANTLTTARNIALSGEVTGNVNFNGSANVTINTTIAATLSGKTFTGAITVQGDASSFTSTVSNGVITVTRTVGGGANSQIDLFSGAAADTRRWSLISAADGTLQLRAFNDSGSSSNSAFTVARSGVVNFTTTPTANGNTIWHQGNDGSGSGLDADLLQGQPASFYSNATNLSSGTVNAARLAGTYNITISGTANNASNFNGQGASYYTNIPDRLGYTPVNKAGDTGIGNTFFSVPISGESRVGFTWSSGANTYFSANVSANTFGLYDSTNNLIWRHDRTQNRFTFNNANAAFILQREGSNSPTISANTLTLDISNTNFFEINLNSNISTINYQNFPAAGVVQSWVVKFNIGGSYSIVWPSIVKWAGNTAPTLPTGAGNTATIVQYTTDGGTKIHSYYAGATP